jgi:bifunctional UDP-N-acetylglucosamine pyrophosphorylase/glucosamine-1-phosphate N-acetyltransferase
LNRHSIILAGGKGSRMLSEKAKVLQPLGGRTMLAHIVQKANLIADQLTLVVGFDMESVKQELQTASIEAACVEQLEQIGTADAVKSALPRIGQTDKILILYGDVPLIRTETMEKLFAQQQPTILTTCLDDPSGYGRVLKDENGHAVGIVEEKDADPSQLQEQEVFTGVMVVAGELLHNYLSLIRNKNNAGEYYLTDLIKILSEKGFKIERLQVPAEETLGANTRAELEVLEKTLRQMKAKDLLDMGITLVDQNRVDVRGDVTAGKDCLIDVNAILVGKVELGNNVVIGPNTYIEDTVIGDNTSIQPFSHICNANIGANCSVGPYARLREGTVLENAVKIGNFVETKKTSIAEGSKASHLSYLGDAIIENNVNIGAGTITCNYDGKEKHPTKIKEGAFIGTNSSLVAPINIGKNAYVGAGSTITKDIPDDALGVGRSKQTTKENWSKKK